MSPKEDVVWLPDSGHDSSSGTTSCESIYRAVYEYRSRYPEKAVTYNAAMPRNVEGNAANWAVFMAGGSLAKVPPIEAMDVYTLASEFQPVASLTESNRQWVMGKAQRDTSYIVLKQISTWT